MFLGILCSCVFWQQLCYTYAKKHACSSQLCCYMSLQTQFRKYGPSLTSLKLNSLCGCPLNEDYEGQGLCHQLLSSRCWVSPAFPSTSHPYWKHSAHHHFLDHAGCSYDQTFISFLSLHHRVQQNNLHNLWIQVPCDQSSSTLPCWFCIQSIIQMVISFILLFLFFLDISLQILLIYCLVIALSLKCIYPFKFIFQQVDSETKLLALECRSHSSASLIFRDDRCFSFWSIPTMGGKNILAEDAFITSELDDKFFLLLASLVCSASNWKASSVQFGCDHWLQQIIYMVLSALVTISIHVYASNPSHNLCVSFHYLHPCEQYLKQWCIQHSWCKYHGANVGINIEG